MQSKDFINIIKSDNRLIDKIGIFDIFEEETDSSHSYVYKLVSYSGDKYFCKVIYDTTLAGTNRCAEYEFKALKLAYSIGISPKPIFYNPQYNILVTHYIESVPYDASSIESILLRMSLGEKLSECVFDEADFIKKHQSVLEDIRISEALLDNITLKIDYEIELLKRAKNYIEKFLNFGSIDQEWEYLPNVLSHNDLVAGNLLKNGDGDYFVIDFETVGITKMDFLYGQLIVDAQIDWSLKGETILSVEDLIKILLKENEAGLSNKLIYTRVFERYVQNVCYGLRQLSISKTVQFTKEYIDEKRSVIEFCLNKIPEVFTVMEVFDGNN
jgi:hypothetical protein